jgi:hypothetical protein
MLSLRTQGLIGAGLAVLTAAYGGFAWLAIGLYSTVLPADAAIPLTTRLTACHGLPFPYHALPGQLAAVISLLAALAWGMSRARATRSLGGYSLPVACHLGCILVLFFLHGIGMVVPFLEFQKVLVLP